MTLLINSVTWTLLLLVAMDRAQGSPQSLPSSEEEEVQMVRLKRQSSSCTFTSFHTLCKFPVQYVGSFIISVNAEIKNIAIPEIADVEIKGTASGLQVYFERVARDTDPNPPRKCSVGDMCFVLYNVVPEKLSACIQLQDETTNSTIQEVGCFRTSLFGLGETTTMADPIAKTSVNTESSSAKSESGPSSRGSTGDSGISCRFKRSGDSLECTTQGMDSSTKDDQDINGSHRIGISLTALPFLFTFFKLLLL